MNAPNLLNQLTPSPAAGSAAAAPEDDVNLLEYWDILVDNRWLVAAVAALVLTIGTGYAFLARPVFEANLLIQVEDSTTSAKSFLGEASSLFDVKTPATAEIEIIRSRMIIAQAVDNTLLYTDARPNYLPVVGNWLARRAKELSQPGILGYGGWVSGTESIALTGFDVPAEFYKKPFTLRAGPDGAYVLSHPDLQKTLEGKVGAALQAELPEGPLILRVTSLQGKPGAEFSLTRYSRLETIEGLQENIKLAELGRQSGVIDARLQSSDRTRLQLILNEIGMLYVRQNIERKAAEAQKTLAFLDAQLPQFKRQLEKSEEAYNNYRNKQGTVAPLDEEAKIILNRSVDLQSKLLDAQQKRVELAARFTNEHPALRTLDQQIADWNREIGALNSRVKGLPLVQQDALRLERDVRVNNDLYVQLRNNALQLELVREGKVGNVRLIDQAVLPEEPVKPKRPLTIAIAALAGLLLGVVAAFVRNSFFRGIRSAQEIESATGLNVFSTIPLSDAQAAVARQLAARQPGTHILAQSAPQDVAVESLRSLRTALQFAMLDSHNNRVLISGATPGVGKSFVSANFASVLASAGKRVLLIDADLRKGHLNQYFGIGRDVGLSELVSGTVSLDQAIRREILPNLDFITTGILPPNPAELAASPNLAALIESLSSQYDIVLIDSAPVLVAADTLSLATHVGTLLLVARSEQTQLGELLESARRLAHAGRSAAGVLFNAVDLTRRHKGSYGYRYGGYRYQQYSYDQSHD